MVCFCYQVIDSFFIANNKITVKKSKYFIRTGLYSLCESCFKHGQR